MRIELSRIVFATPGTGFPDVPGADTARTFRRSEWNLLSGLGEGGRIFANIAEIKMPGIRARNAE